MNTEQIAREQLKELKALLDDWGSIPDEERGRALGMRDALEFVLQEGPNDWELGSLADTVTGAIWDKAKAKMDEA